MTGRTALRIRSPSSITSRCRVRADNLYPQASSRPRPASRARSPCAAPRRRASRPALSRNIPCPAREYVGRRCTPSGMPAARIPDGPHHQSARDRTPGRAANSSPTARTSASGPVSRRDHPLPPARPRLDPVQARTTPSTDPRTRPIRQGSDPDHVVGFANQTGMSASVAATAYLSLLTCPRVTTATLRALRTFRDRRQAFRNAF